MNQITENRPGTALFEAVKEWNRLHYLNEINDSQLKTPSDSEIDSEAEAWAKVKELISALDNGANSVPAAEPTDTADLVTELICNRSATRESGNDEWQAWGEWRIGQPNFSAEFCGDRFKNEHVEFVTRPNAEAVIEAKVSEAKAELKARFIAMCKDYAQDAQPHTNYRLALEDLIEGLENGDENLVQPEPFEALYPVNEQKEELAELLFEAEYQDDAKKLVYPKAHYERIATEVLNYFKTANPEADRYREKFIVADERAVEWQQAHETMRLRLKSNTELLSLAATAIAPFARIQAFLPAGYPDDKIPEGLRTNSTGEYRLAYKIKNDLDKAIDATEALLKPKGSE